MELKIKYTLFVVPFVVLLIVSAVQTHAYAWVGNSYGLNDWGSNYGGYQSAYSIGYQAGQTQAQSDYHSDLSYYPYCSCPEYSWEYRSGYHQGYSASWTEQNEGQAQQQTESSMVIITSWESAKNSLVVW